MAATIRLPHALLAVVVAALVYSIVAGFASAVGAGTRGFGAGSEVVASCGSGMRFHYTTAFDATTSGYAVNGIELTNIPAGCRRKRVFVSFYGRASNLVGAAVEKTLPASGMADGISFRLGPDAVAPRRIAGVSVVVS
jgi:hypothetical protein